MSSSTMRRADPLDSANDRWTGNPEFDRAMLVGRVMHSMQMRVEEINAAEEESIRTQHRVKCIVLCIILGFWLLLTLFLFVFLVATIF